MSPLGDPKIQRFLDTKEMVVLATIQPDGAPLATAMWFLHDPAALTMISVANLQKVRNLRRDPRVSVVAEAGGGGKPVCGVAVEGRAEFLADGPERHALVERFHRKYADLRGYWGGQTMPSDRVMFRILPARVREWGL